MADVDPLRQQLVAAFRDEASEYLSSVRAVLGKLRVALSSVSAAELEEAFRQAHCLKAAARVCDFGALAALAQRVETLLGKARRREPLPAAVLDGFEQALAAGAAWTQALRTDQAAAEPNLALNALDAALAGPPATTPDSDALAPALREAFAVEHKEHLEEIRTLLAGVNAGGSLDAGQVDEAFRRAHSLKGAARIAGLRPAEMLAHRLETLFAAVRDGQVPLGAPVTNVIGAALDAIEDVAATMLGGGTPPEPTADLQAIDQVLADTAGSAAPRPVRARQVSAPVAPAGLAVETVRVGAEHLDRLLRSAGQLLAEAQRHDLVAHELAGLSQQLEALAQAWRTLRSGSATVLRQLADAPELAAVARFLDFTEPRLPALAKQARSLRRLHQRTTGDLQRQVGRLHDDARRVRMVAAETMVQGFRKMLRDLARDEGKRVDFQIAGADVHADRLVLQALKDPLMHALANAVSHGIELPAERGARDKDETGQVRLGLETVANHLRITIEDDGRGIDPQRVARAAVRRGLLSEAEANALTPVEQARLIFRPGLSTLAEVTDVSGRGMGLSVVHEAVARLQGELDLDAPAQGGTRLVLIVPVSIATQRLLLVACRGQTFGLPVRAIERLLRVKPAEIERVEGRPMIRYAGRPFPVRALAELLAIPGADADDRRTLPLLIVRGRAGRLAVTVDHFLAERDALVQQLDGAAARVPHFAGGILLADGTVALVLDPHELGRTPATPLPMPTAVPTPAAASQRTPIVLVVDDSLTTRTLEKSILEAHGYTVRLAIDGVEALARLRAEPVDLVITDVQMPRLDGFALLQEMKQDARLAKLPVIVVTSLGKREDQERGLALGADAYIVKRKFNHEELLETIRQIL